MNTEEQKSALENERNDVLEQIKDLLEPVVLVLGFFWLVLLVVELAWGSNQFTQTLVWLIWAVFLLDFLVRFIIAPHKLQYLRRNWLTTVSLFIPALRLVRLASLVRVLYAARTVRSVQMLRVVSSLNRGIRALKGHMRQKQFGYFVLLSTLVVFVGAAAEFFFEQSAPGGGFRDYWDALYWTGMMVTTLGSGYWPETGEGRVFALLLALYGFATFGYITATLASFFLGRSTAQESSEPDLTEAVRRLQAEVAALREELRRDSS